MRSVDLLFLQDPGVTCYSPGDLSSETLLLVKKYKPYCTISFIFVRHLAFFVFILSKIAGVNQLWTTIQ